MRFIRALASAACLSLVVRAAQAQRPASTTLSRTPPMGFNTWNKFGCDVSERLVREMADAIVSSGMRDAGYRYVVIDDCWQVARDPRGHIVADSTRFPSGMKALADYVHSRGLLFGLYTDVGPKTCQDRPGSYGHLDDDARTYASWGADYLKVDWCHADTLVAPIEYRKVREALRRSGRPIVLSICEWGINHPWDWAGSEGQLWRVTHDIQDNWSSMVWIANSAAAHASAAGPGHWNDPDMLEVGNGGMTTGEYRTHLALWAIMAAPLMAGNDIRSMSDETRAILTNPEVIAVDQDPLGAQGRIVIDGGNGRQVWMKPLADGSRAVAMVNYRGDSAEVYVRWKEIGIPPGPARVRDLWERVDSGIHQDPGKDFSTRLTRKLPPHGVALLKIQPVR